MNVWKSYESRLLILTIHSMRALVETNEMIIRVFSSRSLLRNVFLNQKSQFVRRKITENMMCLAEVERDEGSNLDKDRILIRIFYRYH